MKHRPILISIIIFTSVSSCSDNKAATNKNEIANSSSSGAKESKQGEGLLPGDEGIIGEWQQTGVTDDKNGNKQLDPEERSSAIKMDDYMKLNSDGSAEMFDFKKKGHYVIRKDESSGKKYLDLYDIDNVKHKKGYIMSVTKEELLIMNKFGGDAITIWKRF